ncbi:hypothetical protein [Planomonospora sp. ID82291]|uniref:hypothetical protein n=1 Tax=Planomonospora sp. ID82291 TaxID=2738136 RepID=UPI0018C38202|nr:hypothetical protein [Planomonospora sp. ID82291]MBG0818778.1 hypothetical protein [Planomonospora sp. ID82291]
MHIDDGDYIEHEPLHEPDRLTHRIRRDTIGLILLIVGALTTAVGAATLWHPAAGLLTAGAFLVAAGWLTATSR